MQDFDITPVRDFGRKSMSFEYLWLTSLSDGKLVAWLIWMEIDMHIIARLDG